MKLRALTRSGRTWRLNCSRDTVLNFRIFRQTFSQSTSLGICDKLKENEETNKTLCTVQIKGLHHNENILC